MDDNSNQQPDSSGMVFDSQPVKQDTPVSNHPATQTSSPDSSGMTFDATPMKQDTPVPTGSQVMGSDGKLHDQPNDYLSKTENAIQTGVNFLGTAYNDIGDLAEGSKHLLEGIVGYKASDNAKMELARGVSALKSGNGSEALNHLRAATTDIVTNHPAAQVVKQQWDSSMGNVDKARAAAKKGNYMSAAAHTAGIPPMLNVAVDAVDRAKDDPTTENFAHAAVSITAALSAYYGMFRGAVPSEMTPDPAVPPTAETIAERTATEERMAARQAPTPAPGADTETPVEKAISKGVAKSKLPEGQPTSVAPTGEDIQPNLQQGIRDTMSKVAEENGVEPSKAASIRDVVQETGDAVYAKAKAQFATLDEATGGNVTRYDEQIRNANRALQNVTDDVEEAKLMSRKADLLRKQEEAFKQAEDAGVDPKLVDDARANYRKSQALYDVDSHVKMSTSGTRPNIGKAGAQSPEVVDPKKLSSRLNKVYDSGRLQDAVGEDNAQSLLTHADDAQIAGQQIKEFVPSSPTGQKALADLMRPNTGTGVTGRVTGIPQLRQLLGFKPSTNWLGVYRDMSELNADEMAARFGSDAPQARAYVTSQARRQLGMMIVKGYALKKVADGTGIPASVLHVVAGSE